MDFGKVDDETGIDFTLPPDPPANAQVLPGKRVAHPLVFVGTPSYNHAEWIGRMYPPGPKSRNFLPFYTRQMNALEVNATAYNMPKPETLAQWREVASPGFRYCIKFPQTVTHRGRLDDKLPLAQEFARRVQQGVPHHWGPPLLQFGENLHPKRIGELTTLLRGIPTDFAPAVEMRHEGWFTDPAWIDLVQSLGFIAAMTDTPGRRDVLHLRLTQPRAFIRFTSHQPQIGKTDYPRLDQWAARAAQWINAGLEELYFFVHSPGKIYAPELADYFIQRLNELAGLRLQRPRLDGTVPDAPVAGNLFG